MMTFCQCCVVLQLQPRKTMKILPAGAFTDMSDSNLSSSHLMQKTTTFANFSISIKSSSLDFGLGIMLMQSFFGVD